MKMNYSKVESLIDDSLRRLRMDRLGELATIATLINLPNVKLNPQQLKEIMLRFSKELKMLKEHEKLLYKELGLSVEDEERLSLPFEQLVPDDFKRINKLKNTLDILKANLYGQETTEEQPENIKRIEAEKKRHLYKRFNIPEGWLPLQ